MILCGLPPVPAACCLPPAASAHFILPRTIQAKRAVESVERRIAEVKAAEEADLAAANEKARTSAEAAAEAQRAVVKAAEEKAEAIREMGTLRTRCNAAEKACEKAEEDAASSRHVSRPAASAAPLTSSPPPVLPPRTHVRLTRVNLLSVATTRITSMALIITTIIIWPSPPSSAITTSTPMALIAHATLSPRRMAHARRAHRTEPAAHDRRESGRRRKLEALQAQHDKLQAAKTELQAKHKELCREMAEVRQKLAALEQAEERLEELKGVVGNLEAQLAEALAANEDVRRRRVSFEAHAPRAWCLHAARAGVSASDCMHFSTFHGRASYVLRRLCRILLASCTLRHRSRNDAATARY